MPHTPIYKSDSPYSLEQLTQMEVETGESPRFIYKYRGDNEFTRKIIAKAEIHYPSPIKFNDPFDCRLALNTNNTLREIKEFIKRNNPHLKSNDVKARAEEFYKNPSHFNEIINTGAQTSLGLSGVGCFAQFPDNILMWSHYADSHKGLCLKFDVMADLKAFSPLFKVEYQDKYPSINHATEQPGGTVTKLVTTKAKLWEYEQEWRVLKLGESGAHPYKREALTEVIFGCNAAAKTINEIKQLVKTAGMSHVIFKKAKKSETDFAVDIISL